MSYIENIDNEISSGRISKKEGLELKTHYYSLDNSDRADLDRRFSTNQNASNSTIGRKIKDFFIEEVPDEVTKKNMQANQPGKKTGKGIFVNKSDTSDTIFEKYINANDNQKEGFISLIISLKSYGDPKYDEALEMINKHKRKSSNFFVKYFTVYNDEKISGNVFFFRLLIGIILLSFFNTLTEKSGEIFYSFGSYLSLYFIWVNTYKRTSSFAYKNKNTLIISICILILIVTAGISYDYFKYNLERMIRSGQYEILNGTELILGGFWVISLPVRFILFFIYWLKNGNKENVKSQNSKSK